MVEVAGAGTFTGENLSFNPAYGAISATNETSRYGKARAMSENTLIPLPGFALPPDFPWRVGFVSLVNDQLRRLRATGYFLPPRFFGYYFQANTPIGVSGSWTVTLDPVHPMSSVPGLLDQLTHGQYSITAGRDATPEYLLVQDRRDGACWLWTYEDGVRFVESAEPVLASGDDASDAENPKLLGP
jgi:hypothetical protein